MMCKICQHKADEKFKGIVLSRYLVKYYYCDNCGFLCTEEPYWLNEAYDSVINLVDTGIMQRNKEASVFMTNIIYYYYDYKKIFLDYAGGYGIFVRLMRDIGLNFQWHDLYAKNLLARGFEYSKESGKIELITAIEVFEHFINPIKEIEDILKISKNVMFTTTLLPDNPPKLEDWWYYGMDHGQHISFYSKKTLQFIAKRYNLNYYSDDLSIHLFTDKKISNLIFKILVNKRKGFIIWMLTKFRFKSMIWSDYLLLNKNNI